MFALRQSVFKFKNPGTSRALSVGATSLKNAYDIGKSLKESGFNDSQVDALMQTIEFLRKEGKNDHTNFVDIMNHKADMSEFDMACLKRVSDLKHELSSLHHEDYRTLRNEQTQFDAKISNEISFIKADLALLELRRNSTRELLEKNVEAQLESVESDLSKLEARVMKFSIGLLGTTCLVGISIARLLM
jgi:hypothetical protein